MKKELEKQLQELEMKVHNFAIPYLEYLSKKERLENKINELN